MGVIVLFGKHTFCTNIKIVEISTDSRYGKRANNFSYCVSETTRQFELITTNVGVLSTECTTFALYQNILHKLKANEVIQSQKLLGQQFDTVATECHIK